MGQITNITVKNIKGFSDRDNSIDVDIKSGKINILVAPNGYGKSSITAAFKSLTKSKIIKKMNNWSPRSLSQKMDLYIQQTQIKMN